MKLRSALLTCALTSGLALSACGNDDTGPAASAEESTPAVALAEIPKVKAGLEQAAAQVKAGDNAAAEETVANTYVDHFEKVEEPLEKVDPELKEELEEDISGALRTQIKNGASASQVKKHVDDLKAELDSAAEKLR
jgi:hypothetical protein